MVKMVNFMNTFATKKKNLNKKGCPNYTHMVARKNFTCLVGVVRP